jgi:uncharacterized coiled-coil DUF342 family protein
MEAATPLRPPHVRVIGDRLVVDGLVVTDATTVRLAREREATGADPVALVQDAIEIGARVLDREQTGANAEFVKTEFEKTSREVETAFADRAREVAEQLASQLDDVFGADSGVLSKALERHFSDGSSTAVQHRVKAVVDEVMARSREDLLRQFSSADGQNPLADFKRASLAMIKQAGDQQHEVSRALLEKMAALERELQGLRDERGKQLELEAERERGTAKGRSFEEAVYEAVDVIAVAQGDDCDAVGDLKAATGKAGDVVVAIDACRGPARGRIVFEAKTSKLSKPKALSELDESLAARDADFAVLVVPSEDKVPAKMLALREYNGDKLIVAFDPDDGSRLGLEVAYSLARARVLMSRGGAEGVDSAAIRDGVERALAAMEDVRKIKLQLTGASTSIDGARKLLEEMAERVRALLAEIDEVSRAAVPTAAE